jgi:hypothetical protein
MPVDSYRKKPVVVEAMRFDGTGPSCTEVTEFLGGVHEPNHTWKATTYEGGFIKTLGGDHEFNPGDWIIKGVAGEFYPCKPDIFEAIYQPADADQPPLLDMIAAIEMFAHERGGMFGLSFNACEERTRKWAASLTWGREAPDSPMVSAQALGIGEVIREALQQVIDEAHIEVPAS